MRTVLRACVPRMHYTRESILSLAGGDALFAKGVVICIIFFHVHTNTLKRFVRP